MKVFSVLFILFSSFVYADSFINESAGSAHSMPKAFGLTAVNCKPIDSLKIIVLVDDDVRDGESEAAAVLFDIQNKSDFNFITLPGTLYLNQGKLRFLHVSKRIYLSVANNGVTYKWLDEIDRKQVWKTIYSGTAECSGIQYESAGTHN